MSKFLKTHVHMFAKICPPNSIRNLSRFEQILFYIGAEFYPNSFFFRFLRKPNQLLRESRILVVSCRNLSRTLRTLVQVLAESCPVPCGILTRFLNNLFMNLIIVLFEFEQNLSRILAITQILAESFKIIQFRWNVGRITPTL